MNISWDLTASVTGDLLTLPPAQGFPKFPFKSVKPIRVTASVGKFVGTCLRTKQLGLSDNTFNAFQKLS